MHKGLWWGNKERGPLEHLGVDGMMMMIIIIIIIRI
jgi:hypothetical protein